MNAQIFVIGIGADGLEGLGARARQIIRDAEILIGGERHLTLVPEGTAKRAVWGQNFDNGISTIQANRGRRVVVLASGDPMHFGIGSRLLKFFSIDDIEIIPTTGAFSLAAARMGWSIPDITCLTLHGRALEVVNLHLIPEGRLLILSWDGKTASKLSALLVKKGYGKSMMSVFENMGGDNEDRLDSLASSWSAEETAALNTIAVSLKPDPNAVIWSRAAGLPETAYRHDDMITKREVRAITLAALAPLPGETLWDIGAGNGSVAIEWLRLEPSARAVAIEQTLCRAENARFNANELGVPNLKVINSVAPAAFEDLDGSPDAIFVGGGLSVGLLDACWQRLKPGGRFVSNAVTMEGHAAVMTLRTAVGGELLKISVGREGKVGSRAVIKPSMDVWQFRGAKI